MGYSVFTIIYDTAICFFNSGANLTTIVYNPNIIVKIYTNLIFKIVDILILSSLTIEVVSKDF